MGDICIYAQIFLMYFLCNCMCILALRGDRIQPLVPGDQFLNYLYDDHSDNMFLGST